MILPGATSMLMPLLAQHQPRHSDTAAPCRRRTARQNAAEVAVDSPQALAEHGAHLVRKARDELWLGLAGFHIRLNAQELFRWLYLGMFLDGARTFTLPRQFLRRTQTPGGAAPAPLSQTAHLQLLRGGGVSSYSSRACHPSARARRPSAPFCSVRRAISRPSASRSSVILRTRAVC